MLNCLLLYEAGTLLRLVPYFAADLGAKVILGLVGRGKPLPGLLRAYWWILTHAGWVRRERRKMQATRHVPDREIMRLMSTKVVEGNSRLAGAANQLSALYADLVGLRHHA